MRAFVDTSALLALSRRKDQHHEDAVEVARSPAAAGLRFVGTTLVLGELHAHLLHLRGPAEARIALSALLGDPIHEWVEVTAELVSEAANRWLERFADQPFSLVDAVSFEVMRREKLTHAFAFDRHFEVAGFTLLR
ncbi:MAG: PIN domain-containing protein [Gemmatimonadota bacterium]